MTSVPEPRPKLLCVDDDGSILSAIARLLSQDFTVVTANSAEEALSRIDQDPDVAIVLADHAMGGMTGMELLAQVQEKAPDAARVIFTGQIDLAVMAHAVNTARIHRFILKPWDNDYLRLQMVEALSIHNALKERRLLQSLTYTDPLTQVRNRRFLQEHLTIEVDRALRHKRSLSLLMVDIDHFKNLNDDFGHPAGDFALKTIAQALTGQLRTVDSIARYGGEEFALVLPDTSYEDALKVAERIRRKIEKTTFHLDGGPEMALTISLGVAAVPDCAATPLDVISKADQALYQAKRQGRNQSVGALSLTKID